MGRPKRAATGGLIYHLLNGANARMTIFENDADDAAFETVLSEAVVRTKRRLLSYCVMSLNDSCPFFTSKATLPPRWIESPNGRFLRHRPERSERCMNYRRLYQGQPAFRKWEGVPERPQRKNHDTVHVVRDRGLWSDVQTGHHYSLFTRTAS
jgi:hypothetical protein